MEILIEKTVPQIYTAVSRIAPTNNEPSSNRYRNNRMFGKCLYKCLQCKSDFEVYHRYVASGSCYYYHVDDEVVVCPVCGFKHKSYGKESNIFFNLRKDRGNQWTPKQITLTAKETKEEITLHICGECYVLDDDIDRQVIVHEEFRFNVKRRTTKFITWNNSYKQGQECREIGGPLDTWLYKTPSILWHLRNDNLSKENKADILEVMRCLRKAIQRKWKKFHRHKLSGLYASYGKEHGFMIFSLLNIAYRLVYKDAHNLPQWLNTELPNYLDRGVTDEAAAVYLKLTDIRKVKDHVSYLLGSFFLPNIRSLRKVVQKDIFSAALLGEIGKMVTDPNHILAIYRYVEKVTTRNVPAWSYYSLTANELMGWLKMIMTGRNGAEIRRYLRKQDMDTGELRDIAIMMEAVPKKVREEAVKVKLKDLHDWLVEQQALIQEKGFELEVPEHVVRRLTMQLDTVKFYLPHHSKELNAGSDIFHNCVRTYAGRVLGGKCQIVYMTDDNGKLVACLEVRENRLVQAKLKYNKKVKENSTVNKAVVEWCEKANLEICTTDVDTVATTKVEKVKVA